MRVSTLAVAAVLAALALASPAYADIVVVTGVNNSGTTSVTFADQAASSIVYGSTLGQTNNFNVTGTTGGGSLLLASSGSVQGSGSSATSFTLSQTGGSTFTNLVFNLDAVTDGSVLFHILEGNSNVFEDTFAVSGAGLNFFTISAINGQSIQSVTVSGVSGTVFSALNSVRFGPVAAAAAVPEASTWAMMLLGFGAIGFAMRRKRKVAALAQDSRSISASFP